MVLLAALALVGFQQQSCENPTEPTEKNGVTFIGPADPPVTLAPDANYEVLITAENTGTKTWIAGTHKLGAVEGSIGPGRVAISQNVAPNEVFIFFFTVQAPTQPGVYTLDYQMVEEHVEWFGDSWGPVAVNVEIVVSDWPNYTGENPKVIPYPAGFRSDSQGANDDGGVIVSNLDDDELMEYIVTSQDGIVAFDWDGTVMWFKQHDIRVNAGADSGTGLPGSSHPGFAVIDNTTGAFIDNSGNLRIVRLSTGNISSTINVGSGAQVAITAHLREGRRTVVVQYDNNTVAAYDIDDGQRIWRSSQIEGFDHGPVSVIDVDGDGFDETIGVYSVDKNGVPLPQPDFPGDFNKRDVDSVSFGDINADGILDMAIAEQGGLNRTWAITPSTGEILWSNNTHPPTGLVRNCDFESDPDKMAVGDFVPELPGLETFARSACGRLPWLIDSTGKTIIEPFEVSDVLPSGWNIGQKSDSSGGIDIVSTVHWFNGVASLVFKERHIHGWVGTLDLSMQVPMGGPVTIKGVEAFYPLAVDVAGDHREEIVITQRDRIVVRYHNNVISLLPRLWNSEIYWHRKQTSMYYSTS